MEIVLELTFFWVTQTKSKSHNKFNSFRIMTIISRIGSWSYDMKNFFRNIDKLSELRMTGISLFHSEIVEGKKEFLKKLCFTLKRECWIHFLKYERSAWQELNGKYVEGAYFAKLYKKDKVFCTNVEVYRVLNLILDIIFFWTYP